MYPSINIVESGVKHQNPTPPSINYVYIQCNCNCPFTSEVILHVQCNTVADAIYSDTKVTPGDLFYLPVLTCPFFVEKGNGTLSNQYIINTYRRMSE